MDALSLAAKNVSILLNRDMDVPPVPMKTVRKQGDTNVQQGETPFYSVQPINIVKVFEIWKVFLQDENPDELEDVFVIIEADCNLQGYRKSQWSNIEYKGFYGSIEEAQNEISGYIR